MGRYHRRTATKVRDGEVQKKNRHAATPTYWNTPQAVLAVDRERPGRGYKHLLRKQDIVDFASIVPEWERLSVGLDAVLLARGSSQMDGWYDIGVVGICAWEREIAQVYGRSHVEEHEALLDRLQVQRERDGKGWVRCKFTESTARAYQLLHIFLHELGHHCDRMSTKRKREGGRGEPFAEEWAYRYERVVLDRYLQTFGLTW
jgi:hypothetical protein